MKPHFPYNMEFRCSCLDGPEFGHVDGHVDVDVHESGGSKIETLFFSGNKLWNQPIIDQRKFEN